MSLTTCELESIQCAVTSETLTDTASILRPTDAPDGQGGTLKSWATIQTGVPCRVAPPPRTGSAENEIADRVGSATIVIVTLQALTDVTLRDRILALGRTLEVVEITAPRTWEMAREVVCMEIS